jgi:hypothetical protein
MPEIQPLTIQKHLDGTYDVTLPLPDTMLISTHLLAMSEILETRIVFHFANAQATYRIGKVSENAQLLTCYRAADV